VIRIHALSPLALALLAGLLVAPLSTDARSDAGPQARPPDAGGSGRSHRPDIPPGQAGRPAPGSRGPSASRTPPGLGGQPPHGHGGPLPGERAGHERPAMPSAARSMRNPRFTCGAEGASPVGPVGTAGRSHVAMLRLGEPDSDPNARLAYRWIGPTLSFVLSADNLEPDTRYTLAAVDAGFAACLAAGTSNHGGALQLADAVELDSHLPAALDPFAERDDDSVDATVVLLPTDAIDCEAGVIADADAALIAADGLRYVDTDLLECPE
jgi:hypothetical protein